MNATVPTKSNTPATWATAWALQNASFTGILRVESYTRAGKGGRRGLKLRTNTFYISGGNAAPRHEIKSRYDIRRFASPFINGLCEHCGKLYRNCTLRRGWHASAGSDTPNRWLWACPGCYVTLGLSESNTAAVLPLRSPMALHHERELPVAILNVTGPEASVIMLIGGSATADRVLLEHSENSVSA